jgi:NADPH2:quinone reductase
MKAIMLNAYGGAENLSLGEVDVPRIGPDDVLLKVRYAGVRWGDIMAREGRPSRARPTPFVMGQEASGVVEAVGENVTKWKPGDRAMATPPGGAFAEYVAVPAAALMPVPQDVDLKHVLAYPVNLRTAYLAVYTWAKVAEGERVLVHTAAGGVGLLLVQILKRRFENVTVVGLTSTDEKVEVVRANGADHVINYKTTDYVAEIERIFGPKASGFAALGERGGGVDVSLNGVSGSTMETDPKVIRKRGRWVLYGYIGGRGQLNLAPIGYDGITIMPFSCLAWAGTPDWAAAERFVRDWMASEELIEPTVFPLEQGAEAVRAFEDGSTWGKVVLEA